MTSWSRHIVIGIACLSALALWSAPAAAQTCAMLPAGSPPEGPAADTATVSQVLEAVAGALTGAGMTVLSTVDAQRRMVGEPFAECSSLDCGANVVRSLGVDFVVLVTVWAPRGLPTSVVITFINANDSTAGDAPVQENDTVAAAMSALQAARQRWQASQMGFIAVSSEPSGAHVQIDGRVVGETPIRHLVMSGERTVEVLADGYLPSTETVMVEPTREHAVALTLVVDEGGDGPGSEAGPASGSDEAHWANFLVGGGLVAAGLGLLAPPLHGFAVDGTCMGDAPCAEVHQFGTTNAVLFGLSVAAIAGGAIFMIVSPIRVSVAASPDSASISLNGTFQ